MARDWHRSQEVASGWIFLPDWVARVLGEQFPQPEVGSVNWDFEVPTLHSTIFEISWCWYPSISWSTNTTRNPLGSCLALANLTGGTGKGTAEAIAKLDRAHPGRFLTFTEPSWEHFLEPNFPQFQADEIERAHKAGARGLKVVKTLGLYLREKITEGPLVKVDDRRLDPMWEACAALKMPVAIHVSDPEAFFLPIDRFNERWEELHNHPDWSFYGRDYPSFKEVLEARNRLYAHHPKTQFLSLHVGHDAENLPYVAECMDKFPNMTVELAARIGELGRQPRQSRKFFERYQDRIMFGTDAVPHGDETPQQVYGDLLYEIYFRFLESEDEYFDYAPAAVPPQGRWRIYGLGLPDPILKKVYHANAERLLGGIA